MGDNRCDYNVEDVELDKRFVHCRTDAFFTLLSYMGVIILTWATAYTLSPEDPAQMTYLLGFPLWYAVCTMICVLYSVVGIVWAIRSKKFSLDARGTDEEVDEP